VSRQPFAVVTAVAILAIPVVRLRPASKSSLSEPASIRGESAYLMEGPDEFLAHVEEGLGTKQIEGVTANGRRTTLTIPAGQIGNDRPIAIVDERWESPELRLLLLSTHNDPRTGEVEFRLMNLRRGEPSP